MQTVVEQYVRRFQVAVHQPRRERVQVLQTQTRLKAQPQLLLQRQVRARETRMQKLMQAAVAVVCGNQTQRIETGAEELNDITVMQFAATSVKQYQANRGQQTYLSRSISARNWSRSRADGRWRRNTLTATVIPRNRVRDPSRITAMCTQASAQHTSVESTAPDAPSPSTSRKTRSAYGI